MRPAFVPHILQRPGNFWRLGVFALWVCLNITCSVWNLPYLEQTTCRLDGPCFRTRCWYSTGWSLKLQLKTEFKGICWKHSKTQTSPMGLQSVGQHWNGFINQCRWSLSQLNMDCGLDSVLSGGPRLQMMRGPPVAPPLPRPPPPPPMMLPPSLQGPMPQGPSQPMAAPPQVHKHESVCRLLHVLLRSCKMDERHLEPSRPNLSLSGWWYGFDGVRPTYATSSPTSCQTNTVNHPGSTNCVRCSSCPCWTKKKWSSRSETGPNGILIRAWRTHLFYADSFRCTELVVSEALWSGCCRKNWQRGWPSSRLQWWLQVCSARRRARTAARWLDLVCRSLNPPKLRWISAKHFALYFVTRSESP